MSSQMLTLHEIAMEYAKKQPGIVDDLTEDAPILEMCKWKAASHKLWNVAEKLTNIEGPGFVKPDSPMPFMNTSSDLVHIDLNVLGGMMEVPTQRAVKVAGSWQKYFADKQNWILRKAGMDTEKQIVEKNWLAAALTDGVKIDAGGTDNGWYIIANRFDEETNVGLYDPDQFDAGRLLKIDFPYGGDEHYLHGPGYEGVLGHSVVYRGHFGWQNLDAKRTTAAIVNITEKKIPTTIMIDEILSEVRAKPGNTFLVMSPKAKLYAINNYKLEKVELVNSDNEAKTVIDTWNGIPIKTSYNIQEKIAHVTV